MHFERDLHVGVTYILFGMFRIYLVLFLNAVNVWMLLKC